MKSTIRRLRWSALAAAAVCLASGCYTFTAVQETPPVGTDVRATVTDEEALRLSRQTGALSRTLDGRLVGTVNDSVVVSVVTFRAVSEISGSRQLRQSVVIPRDGLEALEVRRLSAWRSGVLGLLSASGIAMVVNRVVVGGGSNDDDVDIDQPTGTLIPIFRIPVGR